MRALVVDPAAPARLRLAEAPDPVPGPDEVLLRVEAASVNPSDLHLVAGAAPGAVAGLETAGRVVRPAGTGGPGPGTPVTTVAFGAGWAELRAVPAALVGTVPDGVDPVAAATVPIAAGSALRALQDLGPLLGRRILVTGATGAVGRYAVQLAALAGADVVATTRDPATAPALRALGARTVVGRPAEIDGTVEGVLETVGGAVLVEAWAALGTGATLVSVGRASGDEAVFPAEAFLADGGRHGRSLRSFFLLDGRPDLDRDLTRLAGLLAAGRIAARVDRAVPFAEAPAVLAAGPPGKLVLVPGGPDGPDLAR